MVIMHNGDPEIMNHLDDVSDISDSAEESEEGEIRSDSEPENYLNSKTFSSGVKGYNDISLKKKLIRVESFDQLTDGVGMKPTRRMLKGSEAKKATKATSNSSKSTFLSNEDSEDELELRYIALKSAYFRGIPKTPVEQDNKSNKKIPDKENSPNSDSKKVQKKLDKESLLKTTTQSIKRNFDLKDPRNASSLASEILKQFEKSQRSNGKGETICSGNRKRARDRCGATDRTKKRLKALKPKLEEGSLPEPSKTLESIPIDILYNSSDNQLNFDVCKTVSNGKTSITENCSFMKEIPEYILLDETDEDIQIINEMKPNCPMSPDYIRLDEPMDTQSESNSNADDLDNVGDEVDSSGFLTSDNLNSIVNDEEEDEELLRANLLMDIAQKQREKEKSVNLLPLVNNVQIKLPPKPKNNDSNHSTKSSSQVIKLPCVKKTEKTLVNTINVQELARKMLTNNRIIINLNESDDSSSCEETESPRASVNHICNLPNGVENQVDLFLKSARNANLYAAKQTTSKPVFLTPKAISHLPASKQREYRVLKQKLKEKQHTRNSNLEELNNTSISMHSDNDSNDASKKVICDQAIECQSSINSNLCANEFNQESKMEENTPAISRIDCEKLIKFEDNLATEDITDLSSVANTDILQLTDKVLQDCDSLIVTIKSQQKKSSPIIKSISDSEKKAKKERLLKSLKSMEMRVLKQRDSVDASLTKISELLGTVEKTELEVKVLKSRQQELKKELNEVESSLNGKKVFISSTNLQIKNAFVKVQKQKDLLQTNESKCIKYGKILKGSNYNLPRKVSGKATKLAQKSHPNPVLHLKSALRSKVDNEKNVNVPASLDTNKRRVVLKPSILETNENGRSDQDYVSPLDHLRNKCPSNLNPNQVLCHFELMGHCNDDSCEYQHHSRQSQSSAASHQS